MRPKSGLERVRAAKQWLVRARMALTEAHATAEEAADLLAGAQGEAKEVKLDLWVLYCEIGKAGAHVDEQGQVLEDMERRLEAVPRG